MNSDVIREVFASNPISKRNIKHRYSIRKFVIFSTYAKALYIFSIYIDILYIERERERESRYHKPVYLMDGDVYGDPGARNKSNR